MGPCFCDSPTWKSLSGLQRLIVVPLFRPLPCERSYTHNHSGLVALCSQIVTICISVISYVGFTVDPSLNTLFAVCCLQDHEDWASVASQQGCGQSQCHHSRPLRPDRVTAGSHDPHPRILGRVLFEVHYFIIYRLYLFFFKHALRGKVTVEMYTRSLQIK